MTCPTCNAPLRNPVCSRCGTDAGILFAIEAAAATHTRNARRALVSGNPGTAYEGATAACRLHRSRDAVQVLALSALACGRFSEALDLWAEMQEAG